MDSCDNCNYQLESSSLFWLNVGFTVVILYGLYVCTRFILWTHRFGTLSSVQYLVASMEFYIILER